MQIGEKKKLIEEVKFSIKLLSLLLTVPIAGIIIFGTDFYTLWLPYKSQAEILQIQVLSVLTMIPYIFSAYVFTLSAIDVVTNKLKKPMVVTFIMSILTVITEIILLKTTNLGIYAVAGVSSFYWMLKVIIFNPINAAMNLKIKWNTFFLPFLKAIGCFVIIAIIYAFINNYLLLDSWIKFIVFVLILGIIGYAINFLLILNKEERKKVFNILKNKVHKKSA